MTLAVSAVYRGRGIGSKLLESILEFCEQSRQSQKKASSSDDADDDSAAIVSEINRLNFIQECLLNVINHVQNNAVLCLSCTAILATLK